MSSYLSLTQLETLLVYLLIAVHCPWWPQSEMREEATCARAHSIKSSCSPATRQKAAAACKCSQMTKWTLSGTPMRKFSQCLHRGICKMTVCTTYVPAGIKKKQPSRSRLSVCCIREQRSVGRWWWWCWSVSQSLASQIWFLLTRSMVPIIGMFCCHRSCCPWCMKCLEGEFFIFQQDSAPAHRARDTVRFLEQTTPAFISPDL